MTSVTWLVRPPPGSSVRIDAVADLRIGTGCAPPHDEEPVCEFSATELFRYYFTRDADGRLRLFAFQSLGGT